MSTADANGESIPGMQDVTHKHPEKIQGRGVQQVLQQVCGCRVYYFAEVPGEQPTNPESEPCVPHALHQAGMAMIAAGARMEKELRAAAEAAAKPKLHTPDMGGGRYGRGPR